MAKTFHHVVHLLHWPVCCRHRLLSFDRGRGSPVQGPICRHQVPEELLALDAILKYPNANSIYGGAWASL